MNEDTRRRISKFIWILVILGCFAIVVWLIPQMEPMKIHNDHEPPVIVGVKDEVVIYDDYTEDEIKAALLDGVEAQDNMDKGRQAPKITTLAYDEWGNKMEVQDYRVGEWRLSYYATDRNGNKAETVETMLVVRPASERPAS